MINKRILRTLKTVVPRDKKIVIVNIGTNMEIFDSVAPLVGTALKDIETDYVVYGDMENPITALNIKNWDTIIRKNHEDDFIIGVDACMSKAMPVGETYLRLDAIKPGSGVGKNLPKIGNIGILGIVGDSTISARLCSLKTVSGIANDIVDTLVEFDRIRKEEEEEEVI